MSYLEFKKQQYEHPPTPIRQFIQLRGQNRTESPIPD